MGIAGNEAIENAHKVLPLHPSLGIHDPVGIRVVFGSVERHYHIVGIFRQG